MSGNLDALAVLVRDLAFGAAVLPILSYTLLFLAVGAGLGRLCRLPGLAGATFGWLVAYGATDLAYYLCWAGDWPVATFLPVAGLCAALLVAVVRRWMPPPEEADRGPSDSLYGPVVVVLGLCAWVMHVLTPDPAAGYSFYQAWHPLFIDAVRETGRFPGPGEGNLGPSYLTDGMYYAVDVMGLALAGRLIAPLGDGSYASVLGTALSGTMVSLGVLAWVIRRHRPALLLYLLLGLVFFRYGSFFRTLVGNFWGDIGHFAAPTTALALALGLRGAGTAAPWAALAMAFMVMARNYGAAYSLFAFVVAAAAWLGTGRRGPSAPWLVVIAVNMTTGTKEVVQVLRHGLYFPVADRMVEHQRDWGRLLSGTLSDWGLVPDFTVLALPVGALWPALALGALLWACRRPDARRNWALAVPLLALTAPLALEVATGYRMSCSASKLYISGVLVFPWYPAFLMARLWPVAKPQPAPPLRLAVGWGLAALSALIGLAAVAPRAQAWVGRAIESYRDNNTDYRVAQVLGKDAARARERPLVYLYHEPGLGLRYYLGGNVFTDYDYTSQRVEEVAARVDSLEEFSRQLGCANFYFSLGLNLRIRGRVASAGEEKMTTELGGLAQAPWVERVVRYRDATLILAKDCQAIR